MPQYLLLLRDRAEEWTKLSPGEMQDVIMRYMRWREEIAAQGYQPGGQKLADNPGHFLPRHGSAPLASADGPFAEAKEAVSGYFLIHAKNYDDAVAVARTCPHLDYGSIEVREIDRIEG